ncbi:MAG: sigma-54-dependent Fis family transcriptional regulator [Deltaproteobacteria bacterium HGW-Deltaproteobacteria-13]|jgi:transcriptional regulator with PAS, ATPase and Fis domain|nr:MAG: sigma-54-dependent Fis family transcriptional regulator [Deltaproteobacteria bacterium HGW-Deltaproteobacteria-13]
MNKTARNLFTDSTIINKIIKKKNIYISLFVLIPAIYTGISIIGVLLTFQLFQYSDKINQMHSARFFYLIAFITVITFIISFLFLHFFFRPLIQFVNKTQKMPILAKSTSEKIITRDLNQINKIFDNIANILSHVEAKELFPSIIGSSASMRNIFTQIIKVAATDSTVLLCGESGTGKELIASSVYEHSARYGKPFIKINCVAIPEGLLESELFGHEKGSFTGATEQKKGKFEIADKGTVFLDEIGDMPLATQAKLLRVLQEKEFERVGGTKPIKVNIRFIAATNKNLQEMIKNGTFREDLYFRLNVFPIFLPALRERKEDILLIANYFLESLPKPAKLSTTSLQELIGYNWPGNVRELKNVLEQASILSENGIIELHHLPALLKNTTNAVNESDDITLDHRLELIEKEIITETLRQTGGIQVKAANILGINQRSLWHRIKKLQIDVDSIRNLQ